jgi:TatD DNase family protein
MLIDTHSHIYLEEFDKDRLEVVENAKNSGVGSIVLPNIDSESIPKMKQVVKSDSGYFKMALGLHPTSVKQNFKSELQSVFADFDPTDFVAIGEVGIDLYWDKTYFSEQKYVFDFQIELSKKHGLPLIIHSRNSFDEIIDVLIPHVKSGLKGVFHCFPGNLAQAKQVIDYGFYIGIGGVLTYKNSNMPEVVQGVPLERILLETDSPYLSPIPKRGKRNEPAYLKYIADKIAEITHTNFEKVASITTKNAQTLFGL